MSKIPCNVIRDLMILYEDDVCSDESRQMVDGHIEECEACRSIYQRSRQPLPEISLGEEKKEGDGEGDDEFWEFASRAVKKFEKKLTYRYVIIFCIMLLAAMIVVKVWKEWAQFRVNVVPSEDIQVSELYELENGDIYCTFTCKDCFERVNISDMKVPEGKAYQDCDQGWYEISFQYPMFYERPYADKISDDEVSVVFHKKSAEITDWIGDGEGNMVPDEASLRSMHTCVSIYYNGKNKEDSLLIWKEGQKLDPAPAEIEKKVKEEMLSSDYYWTFSTQIIR